MNWETVLLFIAEWTILGMILFQGFLIYISHKAIRIEKDIEEGYQHLDDKACEECGHQHQAFLTDTEKIIGVIILCIGGPVTWYKGVAGYFHMQAQRKRKLMILAMLSTLKDILEDEDKKVSDHTDKGDPNTN